MTDRFDAQTDLPWFDYTTDPEAPNLNTGEPWSDLSVRDLQYGLGHGESIEEIADFLCRTPTEVRQKIDELARLEKTAA